MTWPDNALAVGAALAVGLLIGIERGWRLRDEAEGARVAGVRTFTLLGLAGGFCGLMSRQGHEAAAALIAGATGLVIVVGYTQVTRGGERRDATTAIAALLTLALGFAAGIGNSALALAGATVTTLVLALKSQVHRFVGKLDAEDIKALVRFAVIAGAVLPLLPNRDIGPFDAWNPQKLWLVVVLVTGFSFAGYVANRILGTRSGTILTALIGGAYSSTAVTASLAQQLGKGTGRGSEPVGIALATLVMYLRVLLLVGLLATSVFVPFALLILPALFVAAIASFLLSRKRNEEDKSIAPPGNPIELLPALGFLIFVAVAAVAAHWADQRFGEQGIAILVLITGSLDVDAAIITVGGLEPGAIDPGFAALALTGTVIANMMVKVGVTLAYARGRGRSAALSLLASTAAIVAAVTFSLIR